MIITDCFDFRDQISLYVHVPFCLSKCDYCAFFSKSGIKDEIKKKYTERLLEEINIISEQMNGIPFYTAFIGGGNPGCLSVCDLKKLCNAICKNGKPKEFTIEINPESLNNEFYPLFEEYINRVSVGVQSLSEKALSFLGRNATYTETIKGIETAIDVRKNFNTSINFDFITCLPSWHDSVKDIKTIIESYTPDHLSVYSLTLEENTPLCKRRPILPDNDKQADILYKIWNYIEGAGYIHYEVSNFAISGKTSIHNRCYWNYKQYIGLGSSAASTGFKDKDVYRITCSQDIDNFCKSNPFSGYKIEKLTEREQLEEFVLMGMRCADGLDLSRLKRRWNKTITTVPDGYYISKDRLIPNDNGFITSDAAAFYVDSCL